VVNNALFVSGADQMAMLERVSADGHLSIERLVPVPEDVVGMAPAADARPPADPAPFNHSTKIAILSVQRKDGRSA
jgi:23S rRNA (cytosine1962-C5)-methyltransferase